MINSENKNNFIKIDLYLDHSRIQSMEYDKFISRGDNNILYFDVCGEITYFELGDSRAELQSFLELNSVRLQSINRC